MSVDYCVVGPDLVPRAEHHPGAVFEYYKYSKSGQKPKADITLKVRQHLLYLGWKIESKIYNISLKGNTTFRYRYTDPNGKQYYSLNVLCTELSTRSSERHPGIPISSTPTIEEPQTPVVNAVDCLQAVVNYYSVTLDENLKKLKKDATFIEIETGAKKHLFAVGWSRFHIENGKGKKSLVYSSPSRRKFYTLREACHHYIAESFCRGFKNTVGEERGGIREVAIQSQTQSKTDLIKKKNDEYLMKSTDDKTVATTRVLRSSKRVREEVSPTYSAPRTILSWLIDNNVVLPRSKVHYKDGHTTREGRVTRDGIKCSCCHVTFGLSSFASHAGSTYQRPSANIFLEDGTSLLDRQLLLKLDQNAKRIKCNRREMENDNDYICSVCHYGGQLVLCDQCPSSFHTRCLGLEGIPDGEWFCPSCCCGICNQSRFSEICENSTDSNILNCEQCERRYHIGCLKKGFSNLESSPKVTWFCSPRCEEIFMGLQKLLGKPIPMGRDNLTWTLLKDKTVCPNSDASDMEELTVNYSKLNVAISVMHECFKPVKEPRTGRDIVEDVILCRWSELPRLNFKGFYTVLLEKDGELISTATVRVFGEKVAELPLVGTRFQYRRRGMCHLLMKELEKNLMVLGVERLVLPAVSSLLHTWTKSFGFSVMTESEKLNYLGFTFLDFQGTKMCHKLLVPSLEPRGNIYDDTNHRTSEDSETERREENGIAEHSSGCVNKNKVLKCYHRRKFTACHS